MQNDASTPSGKIIHLKRFGAQQAPSVVEPSSLVYNPHKRAHASRFAPSDIGQTRDPFSELTTQYSGYNAGDDTVPILSQSGSTKLAAVLEDMNERGGFLISLLTDQQGFPIASAAAPGQDPQSQAAVVALIQKTAVRVQSQLGMTQTDEISLFDANGRRLVCRPFNIRGHDMILAVLVPDKNQSYRRLTNNAVNAIQHCWKL
jgi:predicted regulator of Ras-like GTPase activity (Roadblock/LC7/MglB family)